MNTQRATEVRSETASMSALAGYSGLELVAGLADGTIRRPPMAETLPFTLLPPEEGKVRLAATAEARFYNLTNTIHGITGAVFSMVFLSFGSLTVTIVPRSVKTSGG